MSEDDVTDLIETVIDALDDQGFAPSVRSSGAGTSVRMTVEVIASTGDLRSFEAGVAAITRALAQAGIDATGAAVEHPSFRALLPA